MITSRRKFLKGLFVAPAIVAAANIMPVKLIDLAFAETRDWREFSIEKVSVIAKTRALKAEYTIELPQELVAVHNEAAERALERMMIMGFDFSNARIIRPGVNLADLITVDICGITTRGISLAAK